jgi:hypothetical protein
MRRSWLALCIGLAFAAVLFATGYIRITRPIPNGEEVISLAAAYPQLFSLSIPGIALLWIGIVTTEVNWGAHPLLARTIVTVGNTAFYAMAVYLVMRLTARRTRT